MNILMFSNVYYALVGGVERSIRTFKAEFKRRGHEVRVVTPTVEDKEQHDPDVITLPAVQRFNGTDFSVALPLPGYLLNTIDEFDPDVVHSHHPFFLGDTAMRTAARRNLPVVFTYHTMWEHYLHYAPSDSDAMRKFVVRLAVEYCNLCDHVIAPCGSIADILRQRGVEKPVTAIPTGINYDKFASGDGERGREKLNIPRDAFVAGCVGRLAPEKNLEFLARALAGFCSGNKNARALFVGDGEQRAVISRIFEEAKLANRLHMPGTLDGQQLVDAYHALDVFTFSSISETQGLVLAEAMAAGRPVVAIKAPGAEDVVRDGTNGRLLPEEDLQSYQAAVEELSRMSAAEQGKLSEAAQHTARELTIQRCGERLEDVYHDVSKGHTGRRHADENAWRSTLQMIEREWELWSGRAAAAAAALASGGDSETTSTSRDAE